MRSSTLHLNQILLKDLMKDFYILTGIRMVIFDSQYNEILSYPEEHCQFCAAMHSRPDTRQKCMDSNRKSFEHCKKTSRLYIYHCHAGLVEATCPLVENGAVIGYIMFGQITDDPCHSAGGCPVTYKSPEQIFAAAKILEACTFYVLLKDMVSLRKKNFMENLNTFLMEHISEDLSVERITAEFNVSRNKLYESCRPYLGTGIAEHIKGLRIQEAKRLLKETDLPIRQISEKVGFSDYNYFCRTFKKVVGVPARKYRACNQ